MKRHNQTSKKLTLDRQAVRELKRAEILQLEHRAGGTFWTRVALIDDGSDGGGRC